MSGFLSAELRSFSDIRSEKLKSFPARPDGSSAFADKLAVELLILLVHDHLRDFFTYAATATGGTAQGTHFLRFGAGRRLRDMFYAYRNLIKMAYPERKTPLNDDEIGEGSRDLNLLYMHLVGTLDNIAWFLFHELCPERLSSVPNSRIGLFQDTFRKAPEFSRIVPEIEGSRTWWKAIQDKRDPSAHRIPLAMIRGIVTKDEASRYQALNDEANEGFGRLDLEKVDRTFEKMNSIGTFVPWFVHHPDEGPIKIYPTVPEDILQMMKLAQACLNHWQRTRPEG
jgi:hypothetical protein